MLALGALVAHKARLPVGRDRVAARAAAGAAEAHTQAADARARVLRRVDGQRRAEVPRARAKAVEVEGAVAKAARAEAVVGALARKPLAKGARLGGARAQQRRERRQRQQRRATAAVR